MNDEESWFQVVVKDPNETKPSWRIPEAAGGTYRAVKYATLKEAEEELYEFWLAGQAGLRKDIGLKFAVAKFVQTSNIMEQTIGELR